MCEKILIKEVLEREKIEAGSKLVQRLAKTEIKPVAAFWLWRAESLEWWLVIASPWIDKQGPIKAYRKIDAMIASKDDPIPELQPLDISVSDTREPLIKGLRAYARKNRTNLAGRRFRGTWFGDAPVDDAYVYFVKSR
jgi:hypothetical protein